MLNGDWQGMAGPLSKRHVCTAISLLLLQVKMLLLTLHVTLSRGGVVNMTVSAASWASSSLTITSRVCSPGSKSRILMLNASEPAYTQGQGKRHSL